MSNKALIWDDLRVQKVNGYRLKVQKFKGSKVQGFKSSRVQEFKSSKVRGFKGSKVQGFKVIS